MKPNENRLTTEQAAKVLGIAKGTLDNWRNTGRYEIKYLKVGGRVFYRRSDLDAWLKTRERVHA